MKKLANQFFMGIDVQIKRDCPYMVLDNKASCIFSGWLKGKSNEEICEALIIVINKIGFDIFSCLANMEKIKAFEVFPSASYAILKDRANPKVTIDFSKFSPGPKDMTDACVSAVTVQEFIQDRGCEVGGGDGLGKIILPGPLGVEETHPVLRWPA